MASLLAKVRSVANGHDMPLGVAAHFYDNKEYLRAYRTWKEIKGADKAEAQYRIGQLYARGEGVMHSTPDAAHWYRLAADAGHVDAQFQLGLDLSQRRRQSRTL